MKTFQEENNNLIKSFLGHTFFKGWKEGLENFEKLELFFGTSCNLDCKYCYLARYGNELYSADIQNSSVILNNLSILLDWLIKNKYGPHIEIFGGELLIQEMGIKGIELILNKFENAEKKPKGITIPTNYTFLLSKQKTKEIEKLLKRSKRIGIPMYFSASFDGKYCEANRPLKTEKDKRNNKYYDKCFAFNKKWGFGFHPMIYSELIENWKENFLWFQRELKKFNFNFWNLYLLEVRNTEWEKSQLKSFMDFIEFLIEWTYYGPCKKNKDYFVNFLFKKGYNILRSPLSTVGRGLKCAFQTIIYVRLGDLAIVPCHRTSYPPYTLGKFIVKNNKIIKIESENPELMIGGITLEAKNFPFCETCLLKYLCTLGCLGSQFETTGDLFSPIPTVCQLEHAKIYAMIKTYKKLGLYSKVYENLKNEDKTTSFDLLEEMIENKKYGK